eukprot:2527618-Rhodomonas_salina.1
MAPSARWSVRGGRGGRGLPHALAVAWEGARRFGKGARGMTRGALGEGVGVLHGAPQRREPLRRARSH